MHSFISKSVLRPEYRTLFEHEGFYASNFKLMYLFVAHGLPKQMDLFFNQSTHQIVTTGEESYSNYMENNTHSDPMQELVHKDVCGSLGSTYMGTV